MKPKKDKSNETDQQTAKVLTDEDKKVLKQLADDKKKKVLNQENIKK